MVELKKSEGAALARMYGLALCFLMLVFFSSVKLAVYHSLDRDFAGAKVWQQDTSNNQSVQVEDQQSIAVPLLALMLLFVAPVLLSGMIAQSRRAPGVNLDQWRFPSLFLRPPPPAA